MEAVKSKGRPGCLRPLAVLLRALVYHPWYETFHFLYWHNKQYDGMETRIIIAICKTGEPISFFF